VPTFAGKIDDALGYRQEGAASEGSADEQESADAGYEDKNDGADND
jgi:hypothetical protein